KELERVGSLSKALGVLVRELIEVCNDPVEVLVLLLTPEAQDPVAVGLVECLPKALPLARFAHAASPNGTGAGKDQKLICNRFRKSRTSGVNRSKTTATSNKRGVSASGSPMRKWNIVFKFSRTAPCSAQLRAAA